MSETKQSAVEARIIALESKLARMEERRSKIVPPELLDDPNIQELAAEAGKSMVARWRLSLSENGKSIAEARMLEAKEKLADNQKIADEKFAAEIAAVIEHYERTGETLPGYVITE